MNLASKENRKAARPSARKRKVSPEEKAAAEVEKKRLANEKAEAKRIADAEKKRLAKEKKQRVAAEKAVAKRLADAEKKRLAEAEKKRVAAEKAAQKKREAEEKQRALLEEAQSPELFLEALTNAGGKTHQLLKLAEVAKQVDTPVRPMFTQHWKSKIATGDVPPGVATLMLKSGKVSERCVFLVNDVVPALSASATAQRTKESPSAPAASTVKERLLKEFERLDEESDGRYYVALHDLRQALPDVGRGDFDAALNELRRDWVLTLSPAEGRHEVVPQHVLDAGILEQSRLLVYVTRRES